ncbi:molybdopterin oxidoreductase membrane subunit [Actinomycetota bacterium]|nr:molybdopterin oxidoreductase membrane subunit [Actinomycetota bacterium]
MFSSNIIWYLFFAGTGSGATFVAFVLDSYLRRFKPQHFKQYRQLITWGLISGILLVILGGVFLVLDLGRLDRITSLFVNPAFSIVTLGAWGLVLFLLVNIAQVVLRLYFANLIPKWAHIALRWLGAAASLFVMSYTGILLQSLHSVHFWATPLLPVLFVLSSLSSGLALLVVLGAFKQGNGIKLKTLVRISRAHIPLIICELLILTIYTWLMLEGSASAVQASTNLIWGDYALLFWVGVVLSGLLLPIAVELLTRHKSGWNSLVIGSTFLLVGALLLRFCILGVGVLPKIQTGLGAVHLLLTILT